MSVETKLEIVGLKEALREINKLDPAFRRQITKDFKNIAAPVVLQVQSTNISSMALSGFSRKWTTRSGYQMFPLNPTRLSRFVVAGTSGKKPKEFRGRMQNANVFFIRWKSPQATLIEMAAKGILGENMTRKNGAPGRVLWKAWEMKEQEVMDEVENLVRGIMRAAEKGMRRAG